VKGRLAIEDVPGRRPGRSRVSRMKWICRQRHSYILVYTAGLWMAKGQYKVDVIMLNEAGEQKDEKSATFTVS